MVLELRNALAVAMLVVTLGVSVSLAQPPKGHSLWFNVVGRVLDRNGRPIHWGRIYVKDTHAHFLRIKPVDRYGQFSLAGLDARLDYEIYAEQDELVSKKVIISGSQKSPEVKVELDLNAGQ
jgi:hypothetical protein